MSRNVQSTGKQEGEASSPLAKRKILSQTAQLFDPIGYTAPVVIRAKIGLQKLWQKGYEWDLLLYDKYISYRAYIAKTMPYGT